MTQLQNFKRCDLSRLDVVRHSEFVLWLADIIEAEWNSIYAKNGDSEHEHQGTDYWNRIK